MKHLPAIEKNIHEEGPMAGYIRKGVGPVRHRRGDQQARRADSGEQAEQHLFQGESPFWPRGAGKLPL